MSPIAAARLRLSGHVRHVNPARGWEWWSTRAGATKFPRRISRRYSWLSSVAFSSYVQGVDQDGRDAAPDETRRARSAAKARRRKMRSGKP